MRECESVEVNSFRVRANYSNGDVEAFEDYQIEITAAFSNAIDVSLFHNDAHLADARIYDRHWEKKIQPEQELTNAADMFADEIISHSMLKETDPYGDSVREQLRDVIRPHLVAMMISCAVRAEHV